MKQDDLQAALAQLAEQRRLAAQLRSDYARITRSRFYMLRGLWLSLKALFSASPPLAKSEPSSDAELERRLVERWKARMNEHPPSAAPLVSVVIPVYNNIGVTIRCLQSIVDTWFETLAVQIIVVDDGSSDRTAEVLQQLPGLEYIRNKSNLGFIGACNRAAARALGKYVCFLNNDTQVRDAWLDHLVNTAEADALIGAVGAKLVYPDGTLQEAGAILWCDASGWNYGRGGNPRDGRYSFPRDVDYCSGAALMVRRDLFERLGGFSKEFAPMYYEDADLCMGIRSLGYRVAYEPRSEVVHFEGATSGTNTSSGAKRFQEINRPKFAAKWATALTAHFDPSPARVPLAARRLRTGKTILVIDSYVPLYDKDAGSQRLIQIVRMMREIGYQVLFLPDNYAPLQPYTGELQALGVEVLHHVEGGLSLKEALDEVLPLLDYAWICRPNLFAKYAKSIARNSATTILYDTIDLHFVRARREAAILGHTSDESWRQIETEELQAAREAHATIVVTQSERELLRERGIENVYVIPTLHDPQIGSPRAFADSAGLLFIGGYNHTPNVDAAKWLCAEIMPRIWERDPSVRLHLLGSNPPKEMLALANDRVSVPGYVADVSEYFLRSRVFVAPLRFGAGIKGKVGHALSYGLPAVLTEVAAEGFGFENERDCLIADDAGAFADATLRLLSDEALWTRLSARALRVLEPFGTTAMKPQLAAMLREMHVPAVTAPV